MVREDLDAEQDAGLKRMAQDAEALPSTTPKQRYDVGDKDAANKVSVGRDVIAGRPTLLRAFAVEAGASDKLDQAGNDPLAVRKVYEDGGVFDKARRLVDKLRSRASGLADQTQDSGLSDLLHFIVRIVL